MHKSSPKFTFLLIITLILLVPFTNTSHLFSNVRAQGYDNNYNNYYGDNDMYSKYPTKVNKYECRTGPFEGFFVSSVEFCKFKFDDRKEDRDNWRKRQGTPGEQGRAGAKGQPGASGANGINGVNGTKEVNGTNIDSCVACFLDALLKLDSDSVLVKVKTTIPADTPCAHQQQTQ